MQTYRLGIVGCGRPAGDAARTGAARAYRHWRGNPATGCRALVGVVEIRDENARAPAAEEGDGRARPSRIFTHYRARLREVRPDIVSVCTWPARPPLDLHRDQPG